MTRHTYRFLQSLQFRIIDVSHCSWPFSWPIVDSTACFGLRLRHFGHGLLAYKRPARSEGNGRAIRESRQEEGPSDGASDARKVAQVGYS